MIEKQEIEPVHQTCRNCESNLPPNAFFCPNCGQKNTDGRISFEELVSHFLSNLLNFDGRIFQTMGALAVPGKLTKSFFEGKHIRYYHPVRLFILSGAIFIALLSITVSGTDIGEVDNIWKSREKTYTLKKVAKSMDTLCQQIEKDISDPSVPVAFDSLKKSFAVAHKLIDKDSVEINNAINFSGNDKQGSVKVVLDDLVTLHEDSLAVKYGVTDLWDRQVFLQNIRIQKSIKSFLFYLMGNILWMVLIMMPMLALALKLLYIRHSYLYIEHLIFSFHTHTFIFLFYGLLLFLGKWIGYEILNWAILLVGIYLFFSMKRFYGQKWWKTIFKFALAGGLYLAVMFLAMMVVTMASVFLF